MFNIFYHTKAKFLILMGFMFPGGVKSRDQTRDMILIYFAGAIDALEHTDPNSGAILLDEMASRNMPDPAWLPDASWN